MLIAALSVPAGADVFDSPAQYAGRTVVVCGYIRDRFEDANIWKSRSAYKRRHEGGLGLGFISHHSGDRDGPLHDKFECIRAKIIRTDCGGAEKICLWSNFDYAVELTVGKAE